MIEDIVLELSDPSELVMETDRPFDLLDDTVSEATVLSGYRFHRPDGQVAYGECMYDCDTSAGTATPDDIALSKKAYSHGREIVGTYTLAGATQGTATAAEIKSGKTAWVNGVKLTGTWVPKATLSKETTLANIELWIPEGTYVRNQTFQIVIENDNPYVYSVSSVSNVVFVNKYGQSTNLFGYAGGGSSGGTPLITVGYTGSGTQHIQANFYKAVIVSATGTFIRANIS